MAIFVDTNILVYSLDIRDEEKHTRAREFVKKIFEGKIDATVSNQVLSEFVSVSTTRVGNPIDFETASKFIAGILKNSNWIKITYDSETVLKAGGIAKECKVHFWDALIAATMIENGVFEIITENVKDFKKIPGIQAKNPFTTTRL